MSKLMKITIIFIFILVSSIVFIKYENHGNFPLEKAFISLEKSGELPKLDHSKDIKGPVTNKYGVRDDIYQWILDKKLDEQKTRALIQAASIYQQYLLADFNDK